MSVILKVDHLKKYFPIGRGILSRDKGAARAVDDVSFTIGRGETLGLVGESGSGKTTIGRCILRLIEPTGGQIFLGETNVTDLLPRAMRDVRRQMQIIFQDPFGSLTPRMRLRSILKEPLDVYRIGRNSDRKAAVASALEKVGLRPEYMKRYPHEFSGGQRQRIAIARALMLNPSLIVADEPVSALDVSIQAQIINLLVKLQQELDLSYLLISHDMSVVKYMSDRIAVLYLGKIVELAPRKDLYTNPKHPYTEALLSAIPVPKKGNRRARIVLRGEMPSPINPPPGCGFHPRCNKRMKECDEIEPKLMDLGSGHFVACHLN